MGYNVKIVVRVADIDWKIYFIKMLCIGGYTIGKEKNYFKRLFGFTPRGNS